MKHFDSASDLSAGAHVPLPPPDRGSRPSSTTWHNFAPGVQFVFIGDPSPEELAEQYEWEEWATDADFRN